MSNRTQIGTPSYIQPNVLRPSLVRRSSSQRPRVGPRTRSYTGGGGSGHGTRAPEHSRHGASHAPRREINSMMSASNRPGLIRALTATNTSLNRSSPRISQPAYHHSSGGDGAHGAHGAHGAAPRFHQGFQQIITRNPMGHRTGAQHTEHPNTREHSHSNTREHPHSNTREHPHSNHLHSSHHAHVPETPPARRSQRISSALVHNSRPSNAMVPSGGADQIHGGSRGLVRVGGSRSIYPHH